MFVQVRRNPIKILQMMLRRMTKIETVLEFKNILQGNFGFIVVSNDQSNTIHQSGCKNLNEMFTEVGNAFHWFATIALAEKSFKTVPCSTCNPE